MQQMVFTAAADFFEVSRSLTLIVYQCDVWSHACTFSTHGVLQLLLGFDRRRHENQ